MEGANFIFKTIISYFLILLPSLYDLFMILWMILDFQFSFIPSFPNNPPTVDGTVFDNEIGRIILQTTLFIINPLLIVFMDISLIKSLVVNTKTRVKAAGYIVCYIPFLILCLGDIFISYVFWSR